MYKVNEGITTSNFIKNIIEEDVKSFKHSNIVTRFPPEPNGYLHIGHAKSICLNFGLAEYFSGVCNLRFDDTNPEKESVEYTQSIMDDVKWLGFFWSGEVKYASDYFDELYRCAEYLIKQGLAYVCELTSDEVRKYRGSLTSPGKNSPFRERYLEDNLSLFRAMKDGHYEDESKTLRLKIDMNSSNINMRDPVIYRIKRSNHIRTREKWCIYPMYDYAHSISDALENVTHSCCTLEFEDHRPLYNWIIEHLYSANLVLSKPRQIEFSRLELQYTVTSKRKLNELVTKHLVNGWDDPRMPTISGMRRRGYPKEGIRLFAARCGVSKSPNIVDLSMLESSIREVLEDTSTRVMAVINPLRVILVNFDETIGSRNAYFHPKQPELGERLVELTKEIYVEQDDFMEKPISGWQRLTVGGEVRLRHSYIVRCENCIKDDNGNIVELHCSIDKDTLGKNPENRKIKGVIHWVSATRAIEAEVRLYDRLFTVAEPDRVEGRDFKEFINKDSLKIVTGYIEPSIKISNPEDRFQFERLGYFVADRNDFSKENDRFVFNRTVTLKDSWLKNQA